MRFILILIFTILIYQGAHSQLTSDDFNFEQYISSNGKIFSELSGFDKLNLTKYNVDIVHVKKEYSSGYIYDLDQRFVKGHIKVASSNKLLVKQFEYSYPKEIEIKNLSGFKLNSDSFAIVSNIKIENAKKTSLTKPTILKVLLSNDTLSLLEQKNYGIGLSGATNLYLWYKNKYYKCDFNQGNNTFGKRIYDALSNNTAYGLDFLNQGSFGEEDFGQIASLLKMNKIDPYSDTIFFNTDISNSQIQVDANYYALIANASAQLFEATYFDKYNHKILTGKYDKNTFNKNGLFQWYYPSGSIRKEAHYQENKINGFTKEFYNNGIMRALYEDLDIPVYKEIWTRDKTNLYIQHEDKKLTNLHDSVGNRTTKIALKNGVLQQGFYLSDKEKIIYQKATFSPKLKARYIEKLSSIITDSLGYDNYQGIMILKLIIDENGNFDELQIIKTTNSYIDKQIVKVFNENSTKESLWKAAIIKDDKNKNVSHEIYCPIYINMNFRSSPNKAFYYQILINDQYTTLGLM